MKTLAIRSLLVVCILASGQFVLLRVSEKVPIAHDDCMRGVVIVPAGGFRVYQVPVLVATETAPTIKISVQPLSKDASAIDVLVLGENDLSNWQIGRPAAPLLSSEKVTRADLVVALSPPRRTGAGDLGLRKYYVVFSNKLSASVPKTFQAAVRHEWAPTVLVQGRQVAILATIALMIFGALFVATWKEKPGAAGDYSFPSSHPGL